MPDYRQIASRLNDGQCSVLRALDERPCSLGCSEVVAHGLAKAVNYRSALVTRVRESGSLFALNEHGLRVKAELEGMPA